MVDGNRWIVGSMTDGDDELLVDDGCLMITVIMFDDGCLAAEWEVSCGASSISWLIS